LIFISERHSWGDNGFLVFKMKNKKGKNIKF